MIEAIRKFFESNLALSGAGSDDAGDGQHIDKLQLACATLMIEVMNSDHQQDDGELNALVLVLKQTLQLEAEKLDEVIALARTEAQQATSLYEFTQLINEHYDYQEKLALMENLWRVAYADSHLDKYEDYLIRKVAELIYVTHSDFIRTKLKVRDNVLKRI